MDPVKDNPYGMTHAGGTSDMQGGITIQEELDKANIPYTKTDLAMGTIAAEPAHIISYIRPSNQQPVSVFVLPMVGPDSWAEEYLYFVGTDLNGMLKKDWPIIINDLRRLAYPYAFGRKP